jgi:hypothetical protein
MICGHCEKPVKTSDEMILGDVVFHRDCGEQWLDTHWEAPREFVERFYD